MNSSNAKYLLFLLVLTSCKKYDEGGLNTLAKRNLLSHEGKWSLGKYEVNGIDSTNYVISNNDEQIKQHFVRFFKVPNQYYIQISGQDIYVSLLVNDKSEIDVGCIEPDYQSGSDSINNVSIRRIFTPNSKNFKWQIVKLKKKEIVLKSADNIYKITLKEDI